MQIHDFGSSLGNGKHVCCKYCGVMMRTVPTERGGVVLEWSFPIVRYPSDKRPCLSEPVWQTQRIPCE